MGNVTPAPSEARQKQPSEQQQLWGKGQQKKAAGEEELHPLEE